MDEIKNVTKVNEEELLTGEPITLRPIEEELQLRELYLNNKSKTIVDVESTSIEIYGDEQQISSLFASFSEYMGEVDNPETTAKNPVFNSHYAPLNEVLNTTRPVLSKYGLGVIQVPYAKESKATVKTILTHKSGAFICFPSFTVPVLEAGVKIGGEYKTMVTAQTIISAITYGRRGALNPILGTHGESDDDGNTVSGNIDNNKQQSPKKAPKSNILKEISDKQQEVVSLCKELIADGIERDIINTTLEENCGSKNPNSIKDIKLLDKTSKALNAIRQNKKEDK